MRNKLKSFEILLREGAVFDVPDSGPWILEAQDGAEICRGETLAEMIENSPCENSGVFEDVKENETFTYLDEDYLKLPNSYALRLSDQLRWRFRGSDEVTLK
jgi:hypothetical protein